MSLKYFQSVVFFRFHVSICAFPTCSQCSYKYILVIKYWVSPRIPFLILRTSELVKYACELLKMLTAELKRGYVFWYGLVWELSYTYFMAEDIAYCLMMFEGLLHILMMIIQMQHCLRLIWCINSVQYQLKPGMNLGCRTQKVPYTCELLL